jgi:hypothetical protein
VHRALLQEGREDNVEDLELWTLAHIIGDSIDKVTKEKVLRLRYDTGEEEDVVTGAVHRTQQCPQPRNIAPLSECSSSATLSDPVSAWGLHLRRGASPPPAAHAHVSSMEGESNGDYDEGSADDSYCTLSNPEFPAASSANESSPLQRPDEEQSSDAAIPEVDYQRWRRHQRRKPADPQMTMPEVQSQRSARARCAVPEEPHRAAASAGITRERQHVGMVGGRSEGPESALGQPVDQADRLALPALAEVPGSESSSDSWYTPALAPSVVVAVAKPHEGAAR